MKRATVIPPRQYKRRFRDALNRYFIASAEKYAVNAEGPPDGAAEAAPS